MFGKVWGEDTPSPSFPQIHRQTQKACLLSKRTCSPLFQTTPRRSTGRTRRETVVPNSHNEAGKASKTQEISHHKRPALQRGGGGARMREQNRTVAETWVGRHSTAPKRPHWKGFLGMWWGEDEDKERKMHPTVSPNSFHPYSSKTGGGGFPQCIPCLST